MRLCSACLLGVNCRYDGNSKPNNKVLEITRKEILIPICPEQMGGLPTPREACEIRDNRVITKSGRDVTENFERGAREVLKIAKLFGVTEVILKQKSPSCGNGQIYDGTFSGKIIKGSGITAGFLKKNGVKVVSEEEL